MRCSSSRRGSGRRAAYSKVMRTALVATGLVVSLLAGSCTNGESEIGSDRSDSIAAAEAVLAEYFEAFDRGDVNAIMDLRCQQAQVTGDQLGLFEVQMRQQLDADGPLELGEVRDAQEIAAVDGLVSYSIVGTDGLLTTALAVEDGRDVLCFFRTAASYEIEDQLMDDLLDLGGTTSAPLALIPDSVGDDLEQVDSPQPPRTLSSADEQITRSWQARPFGGVTVTVGAYPDPASALANATDFVDDVVADGVTALDIPAAPDAVALRYLGHAWLFAQAPSVPPFIDRVVLPFGSTLVTVQVSGTDPAQLDALLNSVVADVVGRATLGRR